MQKVVLPKLLVKPHGKNRGTGYFAGKADGIVTVGGTPSTRQIICFKADSLEVVMVARSKENGHYLFCGLNPNQRYMLIARDYTNEYTPLGWDNRLPANDLSVTEQQQLFNSW